MGCLQHIPEMIRQICRISETDHAAASFGFAGMTKSQSLINIIHISRGICNDILK